MKNKADPFLLARDYFHDPLRPRLRGNAFLVWACLLSQASADLRFVTLSFSQIKFRTGLTGNRTVQAALREIERLGYLKSLGLSTGKYRPQTYSVPQAFGSRLRLDRNALILWTEASARRRPPKP